MAKCVLRSQPKKDKIWLHILFQPMEGEWRLGCPAKHHRGSTQIKRTLKEDLKKYNIP